MIVVACLITIGMIVVIVRLIDQTSSHVTKVQKTRVRLQRSANFTPQMNAVEKQVASDLQSRKNMKEVSYGKMELTEKCFVDIGKMKSLKNLDLSDSDFQSEWMDALVDLRLRELNLMNTDFNDRGMEAIAKIPTLTRLNAKFTQVTDEGLLFFKGHPSLYELKLDFTKATNDGAKTISAMPEVGQLELVGTKIDGPGIALIATLPRLRAINLGGRFVTLKASDIRPLKNAKRLTNIEFDGFEADHEFMQELSTFNNLQAVSFVRIPTTEGDLLKLKSMKQLTHIKVDRCPTITQAMIDNLRRQMKKVDFNYRTQDDINATH